jgi:hypothetical protein
MKRWLISFACIFQIFYLISCNVQKDNRPEKSTEVYNKDKSFSIYHQYSKDKSKINVHINQKYKKYCIMYDRNIKYNLNDDYRYISEWKDNYYFEQWDEPIDFSSSFNRAYKKGNNLIKEGYVTILNTNDILKIDLKDYYIEKKLGANRPLYVSMFFFECSKLNGVYDPINLPEILPMEYSIRVPV